jgi:hypothetical protein
VDGVLKTWTVVELSVADPMSLSQELGLHPGGKVKLVAVAAPLVHWNTHATVSLE